MSALKVVELREFLVQHPDALSLILAGRENIVCRNETTKRVRQVQARALYQNNPRFWQIKSSWRYFITQESAGEITRTIEERREAAARASLEAEERRLADTRDPATAADSQPSPTTSTSKAPVETPSPETSRVTGGERRKPPSDESEPVDNFGPEYQRYVKLGPQERVSLLQHASARLAALAQEEPLEELEVAEALIETAQDAALANRATLLEALRLGADEARQYTQQMVIETHRMVKGTIRLVDSAIYNDELVRQLVEKSNGTVVQHMTRVFLTGVEFMLFYNRQVMTKGIANRIRIRFGRDYKRYYRRLLPHLHEDYVSLEHVFYGGMKALSEVEINKFATGFLVHDVGKADDIEYHEGDKGYDRSVVERHVKIGYRMVMEKTNYPREAALITGYHHEYYGSEAGYGYFREFLQAYKDANPAASQDYVMAYTMEPLIDFEVLAYFPAKLLEIVDVFDSLTDPNRRYRSPLSREEALTMIREQFVEEHLKIDPILFQLFLDYLVDRDTRRKR